MVNLIDKYLHDARYLLVTGHDLSYISHPLCDLAENIMGYFRTVPVEVEECAYLDGCTRRRALVTIVLPMALPGVICAVLFGFTLCWNEFLYSLVFIQDELHKTLSVGVGQN